MWNDGAHTSTKAFWNSSITQWYLNIFGAEQFWIDANDVQFSGVALLPPQTSFLDRNRQHLAFGLTRNNTCYLQSSLKKIREIQWPLSSPKQQWLTDCKKSKEYGSCSWIIYAFLHICNLMPDQISHKFLISHSFI